MRLRYLVGALFHLAKCCEIFDKGVNDVRLNTFSKRLQFLLIADRGILVAFHRISERTSPVNSQILPCKFIYGKGWMKTQSKTELWTTWFALNSSTTWLTHSNIAVSCCISFSKRRFFCGQWWKKSCFHFPSQRRLRGVETKGRGKGKVPQHNPHRLSSCRSFRSSPWNGISRAWAC